jgi:hypothetical protein
MRRIAIILAGAALALALVGPAVAGANDKSTQGSTITAQHYRGGHGGWHDGRYRHDHGYYRGGHCYGCYGRGSYCNRYGCAYPYYYGYPYGYYYGGYGCNYDYPCGPPYYEYDCTRYRDRSGHAYQDPQCKWDDRCQCYYHASPQPGSEKQAPPPDKNAQPAPNQGQQPPPDQGMQPGPSQGQQPPPDQGMQPGPSQGQQPPPNQGGNQPQPY